MMSRIPRSWALDEAGELLEGAQLRQYVGVVRHVVPAVGQRTGEERRQPQAVHAQPLQVVELAVQAGEIADAVAVGVMETAHHDLVEDGCAKPFHQQPGPLIAGRECVPGWPG